jgi:hypothetical protein
VPQATHASVHSDTQWVGAQRVHAGADEGPAHAALALLSCHLTQQCYLLDNPDVPTSAEALGVKSAASRFGTFPTIWNGLFGAMKALPTSLLLDRQKMQGLAIFSMPIIRTGVRHACGDCDGCRRWGGGCSRCPPCDGCARCVPPHLLLWLLLTCWLRSALPLLRRSQSMHS